MLGLRDPNVNARYHPEKNSDTYLRRLCEVNLAPVRRRRFTTTSR